MEADVERLAQVPELTQSAAEEVYRYFHKEKEEQVNTTAGEPQTDGSSTP